MQKVGLSSNPVKEKNTNVPSQGGEKKGRSGKQRKLCEPRTNFMNRRSWEKLRDEITCVLREGKPSAVLLKRDAQGKGERHDLAYLESGKPLGRAG